MSDIVSYIKLICIVSIAAGVLMTLIPKGKLKGSFVSLCAVITVSVMVMPFNGISADSITEFGLNLTENSDSLSEKTQQAQMQLYESVLADATQENLKNEGITASVSVECESQSDSFTVKRVTVKGSFDAETVSRIEKMLFADFSEADIVVKEAGDD